MRSTLITVVTVASIVAVGAAAFAAETGTATKGDELFVKANSATAATEKAEPLKGVNIKSLRLDDELGDEQGESDEGMDD